MFVCSGCGLEVSTNPCLICGTSIPEIPFDSFARIEWPEIQQHMKARLLIDEEWFLEDANSFKWWPWFLSQDVYVSEIIEIDPDGVPDQVVRVTVETELGYPTDAEEILKVVNELNNQYPFGSFLVIDGILLVTFSIGLNSRSRTLMTLLHNNALIQAIVAHDVARTLEEKGLIAIKYSDHPSSGRREDPDDLLSFYESSQFVIDESSDNRVLVRDSIRNMYLRDGVKIGFENDEVTFFNFDNHDFGVGWQDERGFSQRFGRGLLLLTNVAQTQGPVSLDVINDLNCMMAAPNGLGVGHLGSVSGLQYPTHYSLQLVSFLSYVSVENNEFGLQGGTMSTMNALHQINSSGRILKSRLTS